MVGLGILFVLAHNGISSLGLFKDFKVANQLTAEEAGNPAGILMNLGWIYQSDDRVYYVTEGQLVRIKNDWTERTVVTENTVAFIFISREISAAGIQEGRNSQC
ncbi:hypothetical protein [Acetobacterium tundrae]|uniref:Uncharacterized protein n=1 Tax=Acetobacterium tundrae TaxID=132932 RepID=A0ABR6WHG3_9FIRM|nr:hypothetical protein [Acetobacterium tundrae]MBC3795909.1 hypothetical protein [Acetobacterium tundrae]